MTDANLAQDTGDTVIAQEDGGGKTRWCVFKPKPSQEFSGIRAKISEQAEPRI
jgi:hypothetical protein